MLGLLSLHLCLFSGGGGVWESGWFCAMVCHNLHTHVVVPLEELFETALCIRIYMYLILLALCQLFINVDGPQFVCSRGCYRSRRSADFCPDAGNWRYGYFWTHTFLVDQISNELPVRCSDITRNQRSEWTEPWAHTVICTEIGVPVSGIGVCGAVRGWAGFAPAPPVCCYTSCHRSAWRCGVKECKPKKLKPLVC